MRVRLRWMRDARSWTPRLAAGVIVSVVIAACGAAERSVPLPTETPAPGVAVATLIPTPEPTRDPGAPCARECWPLNGKPAKLGATDRRPLVVKIDNAPAARPHYG